MVHDHAGSARKDHTRASATRSPNSFNGYRSEQHGGGLPSPPTLYEWNGTMDIVSTCLEVPGRPRTGRKAGLEGSDHCPPPKFWGGGATGRGHTPNSPAQILHLLSMLTHVGGGASSCGTSTQLNTASMFRPLRSAHIYTVHISCSKRSHTVRLACSQRETAA